MGLSKPVKYSFLAYYQILLDAKFDPIKSYLERSTEMIEKVNLEMKIKVDNWNAENRSYINVPEGIEQYFEEISTTGQLKPILYNSILLSTYSMFEYEFLNLCLDCHRVENCKLSPKDINGNSDIDQYRRFITKLLEVNLDSLNTYWQAIQKYRKIRNSFTHKNGVFNEPKKDMLKFINDADGIRFDSEKKLIVIESTNFLKNFVDLAKDYLLGVANEIVDQKNKNIDL